SAISWRDFRKRASQKPARIILADGSDPRVVEAAALARRERLAEPLLIGSTGEVLAIWKKFAGSSEAPLIDPQALSPSEVERFVKELQHVAKFKALSATDARKRLNDPLIFGCLYTRLGLADGFIGGATRTTG